MEIGSSLCDRQDDWEMRTLGWVSATWAAVCTYRASACAEGHRRIRQNGWPGGLTVYFPLRKDNQGSYDYVAIAKW